MADYVIDIATRERNPVSKYTTSSRPSSPPLESDGGDGHDGGMETRLSKLEGGYDGIKQSQNILIMSLMGLGALVFAVAAIIVTLQIQMKGEISAVANKVDALPESVGTSVREANRAFSDALGAAIQATRTNQPAVIILPQSGGASPDTPRK